jgi:hypothetical protein
MLAVAIGAALLLALVEAVRRWFRRRALVVRFERARTGESRARQMLEANGYSVIAAQFAQSYTLMVNGVAMEVPLRADYLVARDGLRYVAEVKTGALAPQLRTSATRRQLLEYRVAFHVDGVLLVDAEDAKIHVVQFPLARRPLEPRTHALGWVVVVAGLVALLAAQWR